jgi:type I restriction enzyme M protein
MLSNPPFGVTWGGKDGYETEARKLEKTRYQAGMPRVNDGALLFLQTMLAKMKPQAERRQPHRHHLQWLAALEWRLRLGRKRNPPLDTGKRLARRIVMLPDQLFYNTGIFTYVWLLRNDKPAEPSRQGDAHRRPQAVRERTQVLRQQAQPHHRQPPPWIEDRYRDGWRRRATTAMRSRCSAPGFRLPQGQRRVLAVR